MTQIAIRCRRFRNTYRHLNGRRFIRISCRDVIRAISTLGAQDMAHLRSLRRNPVWRFRHSQGMATSQLLERNGNDLVLTNLFQHLDPSEKGIASYWLGMAMAKIVADTQLGVPWLLHVDQMHAAGALTTNTNTNERGDLVGHDTTNAWHVIEAKGRSNAYPKSLVSKAKRQSARVSLINHQHPATTSACITSLFTSPISVLLDDPTANDESKGEHWQIEKGVFFKQYYRGIIEYLSEFGRSEQKVGNATFVTAPLVPFFWDFFYHKWPLPFLEHRLEIGLLASIFKTPEHAPDVVRDLLRDDNGKVGSDGIAIFGLMPEWEDV